MCGYLGVSLITGQTNWYVNLAFRRYFSFFKTMPSLENIPTFTNMRETVARNKLTNSKCILILIYKNLK